LQVTQAHPALSASISAPVITAGSTATLTALGLPEGATGTITFTGPDSIVLCTATLPAISCATSPGLAVGSYAITATYLGDPNVAAAQVAGTMFLQVEPAPIPVVSVLPGTGTPALRIVATGLILLMSGCSALLMSKRARRRIGRI
jgi:hypothetical protein